MADQDVDAASRVAENAVINNSWLKLFKVISELFMQGAKKVGKDAVKKTGKETTKKAGKEAAKEEAKQVAKETAKQEAKEATKVNDNSSKIGQGFPKENLPRNKHGEPVLDSDYPHTRLGTKDGKYPQAREFDANGKPVRDIDFTDHGRPQNHSNPHQHKYTQSQTGGTLKRNNGEPLD